MLSRFQVFARALAFGGLAAAAVLAAAPASAQSDREPLARFEDAICPGVVGLKLEAAEALVGRIRANADALGLRLAPEGDCKANVVVAVLADGGDFLEEMRTRNAWLFAEMSNEDARELMADPGPARAFLRVRARSRDGIPIPRRESLADIPETTMWMAHSKIYTATRNDILSALVLFDRGAMAGLTITQLADYATMRALTRTLPDVPEQRPDSILALFEGVPARPTELSEFDRNYLGGLYHGMANLPATAQIARLEEATGRDIFTE